MAEERSIEELQKQIEELTSQNKNLKSTLSERNSEAAQKKREAEEWKTKYQSTLSEQEKAEADRKAAEEARDKEFAELKRDNSINKFKARYMALGYTEELAQSSAEAKVDGNDELLFANEQAFLKARDEKLKADLLKSQPELQAGSPPKGTLKKEEILKIKDTEERQRAWAKYLAERR